MPIRINLLAEAQDAEELRRKDPVKRALWAGGALVGIVLLWSGISQVRLISARSELKRIDQRWRSTEAGYAQVVDRRKETMDVEQKLKALDRLATNRFLWGTALNALQKTLVEDVQVLRINTSQTYSLTEDPRARAKAAAGAPVKPATASEKIAITIDAKDSSDHPGDQVNKFKESIATQSYFQEHLQKTNGVLLTTLSPPEADPEAESSFVKFTLQCLYPETVR